MAKIPCPHCGSPAMIKGNHWECGYCGDFGLLSSLSRPVYKRLRQESSHTIELTFSVVDVSEDEKEEERTFSREELEQMVRNWDFSENEFADCDLLIASFPEAVKHLSKETLEDMIRQA